MPTDTSSYPHFLTGLTPREEITDALIRACAGLDGNDLPLWLSAWASSPDVKMSVSGRGEFVGMEEINKRGIEAVGPMETQHLLSGIRIALAPEGKTAHVTANALNQHLRAGEGMLPGAPYLLAGSTYELEMIHQQEEGWRIKTWKLNIVWTQGDFEAIFGGH